MGLGGFLYESDGTFSSRRGKRCYWSSGGIISRFFISGEGDVYGFGSNAGGQLGIVDRWSAEIPQKIEGISGRVVKMTTTVAHSLALTENGELYGWGNNHYGALGVL